MSQNFNLSVFFSLAVVNGVAVNSYFDIPCDFFSGVSKDILICVAYPCSHTKRCGNDHFRQNILHLPKMQNITPHKLRGMIHFISFMKVLKELLWKMFVIINIWINSFSWEEHNRYCVTWWVALAAVWFFIEKSQEHDWLDTADGGTVVDVDVDW